MTVQQGQEMDSTDRRLIDQRLFMQYRTILETALDAIVSIDHHGKIIEFNPAAEKMFGYNREEVLGQEMAELIIPPSLRDQHYKGLVEYLKTGEGPLIGQRVEIIAMRADGTEFPVELAITPVPLDDSLIFTGYIRDITERKRVEEEHSQLIVREQEARTRVEAATKRLEALQTVTDTALAHLALDDLLQELLVRVREIMAVDNAAILLLNEDGKYLTMRAAIGPEEEVASEVRVPVGRGFAGSIVANAMPRIVEDLTAVEIMTPLLRERIRSLLGVPLLIEDQAIGVMHIGTESSRRFTEEDVQFLQRVADRIALAIAQSQLYEAEQRAWAEATMRANELETTFETIADAVFVYTRQNDSIEMNAAARELMALVHEPVLSPQSLDKYRSQFVMYDEQGHRLPESQRPLYRVLEGEVLKGANTMDVMLRTHDNHELRFSVSGAPIYDPHGHISGGLTVFRDVTERRKLEQRTSDTLNALLAMAGTLVLLSDEADLTREHSPQAASEIAHRLVELTCTVLGCRRVSISIVEPGTEIVRPLAVVGLTPEQEQQWWAEQQQQENNLRDNSNPELVSMLRANEVLILDMTQPPFNSQPNPYGIRLVCIAPMIVGEQLVGLLSLDYAGAEHTYTPEEIGLTKAVGKLAALVIERERLLQEREEARASELALREANRRMDEFLGIASHEMRTPLTTIKANVQLAMRELKKLQAQEEVGVDSWTKKIEVTQELLKRSDQQSGVLNRLVGDLMDVSRIHADKLELHLRPEPYNLVTIVRDAVQDAQRTAPKRSILLEIPAEELVPVLADADRISQVVKNYLTNALKYSATDQPVEVSLQMKDGVAQVSVRDQGPGLPPPEQERIWERFYQARGISVQSGSSVGLGLGLHISKTIIERHGGQVGVQSSPGKGSNFWFALPLANSAE